MGVGYGYVSDFIVVNLYFLVMNNKFEIGMKVDLEVIFKIQFYCLLYEFGLKIWYKVNCFQ